MYIVGSMLRALPFVALLVPAVAHASPSEAADAPDAPAESTTTQPAEPAEPAAPSDSAEPAESEPPDDPGKETRHTRGFPRIVIAGGPLIGPHALGNEECSGEMARCEKKGAFFGVGGHVEVRGRLWRALGAHVRGLAIKNVAPTDRVHSGLVGFGAGLGAYDYRIFGRVEYVFVQPLGDNRFEPPFFDGAVGTDTWGRSAGLISVGFRQPLPHRLAIELWGGLMLGPRSVRRVPQQEPDERRLTTFQVGLNLAWDAWR